MAAGAGLGQPGRHPLARSYVLGGDFVGWDDCELWGRVVEDAGADFALRTSCSFDSIVIGLPHTAQSPLWPMYESSTGIRCWQ